MVSLLEFHARIWLMALNTSQPIPGQENLISTTTSNPNSNPISVTTGNPALRSAWRTIRAFSLGMIEPQTELPRQNAETRSASSVGRLQLSKFPKSLRTR